MNILVIGDLVGKVGVEALKKNISNLKNEYNIDFTIVNAENSADGRSITKNILDDLYAYGVDTITMGNHTWGKKEIFSFIDDEEKLIRPANYAENLPGKGSCLVKCKGKNIGVINLIGRVDMGGNYECPFVKADKEIEKLKEKGADIIVIDFHAEATAEKKALAYYLKDKANIIFGTHTHVQSGDEEIYDTGLGYITDVGMTGPKDSIIGMEYKAALKRFLTQIPERYVCAEGKYMLNGCVFSLNDENKVTKIERIRIEEKD
ncbi:MAG: TIGR00282 family metallophosphoesterase [Clostridia bacterium]|nr:TIGR00282 family metallophosphoesterase [Clostridia bacterium]